MSDSSLSSSSVAAMVTGLAFVVADSSAGSKGEVHEGKGSAGSSADGASCKVALPGVVLSRVG